ncbi:MAG TPA: hypothetical protein VLA56_12240 [Pseudomonadales bacterium]|nr:hypothetical protein [Pseudomonadales bacterium]
MSVLELTEESRSLRQAAKAWSNGDIPLADYRMIRRATLEGMIGVGEDDDDPPENLTEPNDDTEVVDPVEVTPRGRQKANLMIMVAVAIIIGALLLIVLA